LAHSVREQAVQQGRLVLLSGICRHNEPFSADKSPTRPKPSGIHRMKFVNKLLALCTLLMVSTINAGEADVTAVDVGRSPDGTYRFDVTVRHGDEGWDHYANKWDVVGPDGQVLGTRTLYHPHVDEQPFTRSLSGVIFPKGINKVTIRAHDLVHEYGGKVVTITLPQ